MGGAVAGERGSGRRISHLRVSLRRRARKLRSGGFVAWLRIAHLISRMPELRGGAVEVVFGERGVSCLRGGPRACGGHRAGWRGREFTRPANAAAVRWVSKRRPGFGVTIALCSAAQFCVRSRGYEWAREAFLTHGRRSRSVTSLGHSWSKHAKCRLGPNRVAARSPVSLCRAGELVDVVELTDSAASVSPVRHLSPPKFPDINAARLSEPNPGGLSGLVLLNPRYPRSADLAGYCAVRNRHPGKLCLSWKYMDRNTHPI